MIPKSARKYRLRDVNANLIPPPETLIVKMRGRPAGSKNKAKAENLTIESAPQPAPQPMAPQPDPMYTALMKRLDAMDGMLAQRKAEIAKKEKAPPRPSREGGKGYIRPHRI